jgi:hypothetical protein
MTRKELSAAELMDIKIDVVIDILTLVNNRYSGREEEAEIAEVLATLRAKRHDKAALIAAFPYCSDGWTVGPIN